jgi:hypothetical protein
MQAFASHVHTVTHHDCANKDILLPRQYQRSCQLAMAMRAVTSPRPSKPSILCDMRGRRCDTTLVHASMDCDNETLKVKSN